MSPSYNYDRRTAATKTLDLAWVEGLRKDFLTLLKNLPRVKDYKTAHQLRDAVKIYRENFNELFFEHFLNHDLKYGEGVSESDARYIDQKIRGYAWSFAVELSVPIGFADEYYSEEARFRSFEKEFPAWKARVQRKAQVFWKEMKEVIEYFEQVHKKPLTVKVPTVEKTVLEGFQLIMRGFEEGDEHHEAALGMLKAGLSAYRQRAAAVAPILLKKQLPVECEFKATLDKGGEYHHAGYISLYMSSVTSKGPKWVTHVMAHEMGHHLFRTVLSKETQTFWHQTIKGDFGDLDLKELLDKWPGDAWAFNMIEKIGDSDPILALQVDAVSHDNAYGDLQTKEDFQKLYDSGTRTVRVPKHPVTGYGNKNPEEAFCEAIGLLVAYGPRAVHERVRWWLDIALPGQIRVASEQYDYDRTADATVGKETFGPFNVQYLPQHASFVPQIGDLLLEAAKRCAGAGYKITHDIEVLITGRGAAHALAIYYAQSPPTIKIAPKAYNRADLVHTLVHELGHYFHDKVVPGGFRNADIAAKYRWAVRQKSETEGSSLDAVRAKIVKTEAEIADFVKQIYAPPRKGTKVEFDYNWFGKKFRAVGVVGKKAGKDIEVELAGPPELVDLVVRTYRRPVLPVGLGTLTTPSPADLAKLTGMRQEVTDLQRQVSEFAKGTAKDNVYEVQFHDWLPTTYSKKNVMEWFAELMVTDVLGHLKPDPSAWLKSMVNTGAPPKT